MSDIALIEDSARRTIADGLTQAVIEASEQGTWAASLWDKLEAQGLVQPAAIAEGSDPGEGLEIEAAVIRAASATATGTASIWGSLGRCFARHLGPGPRM